MSRRAISGREQLQQTMCANAPLFVDHLVGDGEQHRGYLEPSAFAVLRLMAYRGGAPVRSMKWTARIAVIREKTTAK
jgi:hypothetical protein